MRLLCLSLLITVSLSRAADGGDILLDGYYLGKASIPFWMLPTALDDGDDVLKVDLGLMAVLTVPATGVLIQHWFGDPESIRLWRKINFAVDLTLAGGGVAYGLWTMTQSDPGGYNGLVGIGEVLFSGLYGLTCLVDRVPFSSEPNQTLGWSLQPSMTGDGHAWGLALRHPL